MSWVSERNLVAAISNAGGFGVVACGSLAPDQLAAEIDGVFERCDKPFGVNIIVMHPELDALVGTCIDRQVGHVVLAGGMPPKRTIETLKEAGTRVVAFAPTLPLARRLAKQGIDAIIIEGMEAGGHIGPVSTNVPHPGGAAPVRRGAGLRRRRDRAWRCGRALSGDGRRRLPAGDALRVRDGIDRPSTLQAGDDPGECARRAALGADRPRFSRHSGARRRQQGDRSASRRFSGRPSRAIVRAKSNSPVPSLPSSISGPARSDGLRSRAMLRTALSWLARVSAW